MASKAFYLFLGLVFLMSPLGCVQTNELVGCVEIGETPPIRYLDPVFENVDVTADINYGQAVNFEGILQDLFLDLYEPAGDAETERPTVIYAVGGGFRTCNNKGDHAVLVATEFAKRGYVVASITYRVRPDISDIEPFLNPEIVRDAQHDMLAAVRWFRANANAYGIDTNRVIVTGNSAGAITALTANASADDPGDSGNPGYPSETAAALSLSGGAIFQLALLESDEGPIFLAHGTNDPRVPFILPTMTCLRAETVGVDYSFWTYDTGHGLWEFIDDIMFNASEFLYCHLMQAPE